jgi:hypothetical protein
MSIDLSLLSPGTVTPQLAGATVAMTHHAPHPRSIHSRYGSELMSAALLSITTTRLTDLPDGNVVPMFRRT